MSEQQTSGPAATAPRPIDAVRAAHRALGSLPGLDGLRCVGVLAVAAGHSFGHSGEYSLLRGVFFAISVFFTLSGFLITSLLLLELEHGGAIGLKGFWSRRFRRLIPASMVGITVVLGYSWFAADSTQLSNLTGDVAAALSYTTNWRQLFAGQVYTNQIGSPTPLLHYWSLAIEEQFYLVLPVVMIGAHRLGRGHRRAIPGALGALALISLAITAVLVTSDDLNPDRIYYGTDTRAVEFLAGSLLAVWFTRNRDVVQRRARELDLIGWVAFLTILWIWWWVDIDDAWVHRGGLLVGIIPGIFCVLGASVGGSLSKALSIRPLAFVGGVSYGVYVIHWPIILWLDTEATGIDTAILLPIQLAISIALAWCSHTYLEDPIRRRTLLTTSRTAIGAAVAGSAVLVGLTYPIVAHGPTPAIDFDAASEDVAEATESLGGIDAPRVGFFGDSTSTLLAQGVYRWAADTESLAAGGTRGTYGCGLVDTAQVKSLGVVQNREGCPGWKERWRQTVEGGQPDLAVVSIAVDVSDQQIPGSAQYTGMDDPAYVEHMRAQMLEAVDILTSRGGHVVWLRQPYVMSGTVDGVLPTTAWPENDPTRMDRYNQLIDEVAALRPGKVTVLDLQAHLASLPGGEMDLGVRPDLVHMTTEASVDLAETWLGPALVQVATELGLVDPT